MKGTLNFSIDAVCEGYDWIDKHHISDKREWWVLVRVGSRRYRRESADTYGELRKRVKKWWCVELPPRNELHFKNYGSTFNKAAL